MSRFPYIGWVLATKKLIIWWFGSLNHTQLWWPLMSINRLSLAEAIYISLRLVDYPWQWSPQKVARYELINNANKTNTDVGYSRLKAMKPWHSFRSALSHSISNWILKVLDVSDSKQIVVSPLTFHFDKILKNENNTIYILLYYILKHNIVNICIYYRHISYKLLNTFSNIFMLRHIW